jgi:hypothetical protein
MNSTILEGFNPIESQILRWRLPLNICIVTRFDCSYEEFTAMLAEVGDDVRRCTSAWEVTEMNEHTAVGLMNVTDMEGLQSVMSSPKVQEWNAANNAVADVYSLEKIS